MSGINGDKSRFNRNRKRKIARRQRNREMMKTLAQQNHLTPVSAKPNERTA